MHAAKILRSVKCAEKFVPKRPLWGGAISHTTVGARRRLWKCVPNVSGSWPTVPRFGLWFPVLSGGLPGVVGSGYGRKNRGSELAVRRLGSL